MSFFPSIFAFKLPSRTCFRHATDSFSNRFHFTITRIRSLRTFLILAVYLKFASPVRTAIRLNIREINHLPRLKRVYPSFDRSSHPPIVICWLILTTFTRLFTRISCVIRLSPGFPPPNRWLRSRCSSRLILRLCFSCHGQAVWMSCVFGLRYGARGDADAKTRLHRVHCGCLVFVVAHGWHPPLLRAAPGDAILRPGTIISQVAGLSNPPSAKKARLTVPEDFVQ